MDGWKNECMGEWNSGWSDGKRCEKRNKGLNEREKDGRMDGVVKTLMG